jgi:hypothetical protein
MVKEMHSRKFVSVAIKIDDLVRLLAGTGFLNQLHTGPMGTAVVDELPEDARIVHTEITDQCLLGAGQLRLTFESDSLPDACEFVGHMAYSATDAIDVVA